jgi:hypothetical protein
MSRSIGGADRIEYFSLRVRDEEEEEEEEEEWEGV